MLSGAILLFNVSVNDCLSSMTWGPGVNLPGYFCVCLERAAISSSMGWDVVTRVVSLLVGAGLEGSSLSVIVPTVFEDFLYKLTLS